VMAAKEEIRNILRFMAWEKRKTGPEGIIIRECSQSKLGWLVGC